MKDTNLENLSVRSGQRKLAKRLQYAVGVFGVCIASKTIFDDGLSIASFGLLYLSLMNFLVVVFDLIIAWEEKGLSGATLGSRWATILTIAAMVILTVWALVELFYGWKISSGVP